MNGPHSTSQVAFDAVKGRLEPETSRTFEIGVRSSRDLFDASIAVYRVDFENRLLAIAQCAGIVGCASAFANVGDVETRGAEAVFQLKPMDGLVWYNSLSWNDSEYASDYVDGENVIRTAGKQVVDAPKKMFASEIQWNRGGLSLQLGAKYTDRRYISYLNDSSVPGFWVADAGASYAWTSLGWVDSLKIKLDVTNLFDKSYFSGVGTNGFVVSDPNGLNYTLNAGAPRQFFITADLRF